MAEKIIPLNDAEKKLLSDRYLDLQFEQDTDEFVCVRCDKLAVVHFFTNCGHLLCHNCKKIVDNGGFNCPQCKKPINYAREQQDEFERRLLALRTKCPNNKYGCQLTTNLAQIPEHVGMCKFTKKKASSTVRNTMISIIATLYYPLEQISTFTQRITTINDKVKDKELQVFESLCLKWTIKHKSLVKQMSGRRCELTSGRFPVYGFQSQAQLKLKLDRSDNIKLYLCFLDKKREGQKVDIKLLPMVTFILKDLRGHNKHLVRVCYFGINKSLKYNKFRYMIKLKKPQWTALISPSPASLKLLCLVEPMTIMNKPLSVDGAMMDTIEHYSWKLQMEKEGLIEGHWSPPFLTHVGGYRVAVRMALNGTWNEGGPTAFIYFLSGECEPQLKNKFAHETSVTLINHLDAKKNITDKEKAQEASRGKNYSMAVATRYELSSGGFLVNDTLKYHVTVKPLNN